MSDLSPKVIRIRSTPKTIQLVPYWPDNAETWFLLAEADFCEHGITDQRSQLLAVIHALPREFSKYVTSQMLSPEVRRALDGKQTKHGIQRTTPGSYVQTPH
uniref:DUF7041 domain-containing protein n=1 Tax=Trichobilharzia regenti TaxID=157069 RepID=A0AA85JBE5_TRIRE|nr:unnamed protein product [Trichobilharzia regenti]CAH8872388.1 unnamed protein product [Trichobilharzia regenti]